MEMNLIRKVAWSVARTTGLEFEDLLSEGCVIYLQAEKRFDPTKDVCFSTFMFKVLQYDLDIYATKQRKHFNIGEEIDQPVSPDIFEKISFKEVITKNLSEEAKEVISIIYKNPAEFILPKPKHSRTRVKDKLREMGWSWKTIWSSFNEISEVLNAN